MISKFFLCFFKILLFILSLSLVVGKVQNAKQCSADEALVDVIGAPMQNFEDLPKDIREAGDHLEVIFLFRQI